MTPILKRNINIILPLLLSVVVWQKTDPKLSDPKKTLMVMVVVFVLAWIVTNQITSYALKKATQPKEGELPTTVGNFDYITFAKLLYEDIHCKLCWRDKDLYKQLASMPDVNILAVNKYWAENYYHKNSETMRKAIDGEVLGWELEPTRKALNKRFDNLKIM